MKTAIEFEKEHYNVKLIIQDEERFTYSTTSFLDAIRHFKKFRKICRKIGRKS